MRATVWVTQPQGVMWGKMSPSAGWRTAGTNMRTMGSLDTTWEEQAGANPPYKQGREGSAPTGARFPVTTDLAQVPDLTEKTF